jgi:GTP-binding protein Era
MKVKSGFITLLGLPNAGKSSFFNKLIGEELAIVSPRAQTTWVSMRGFYSSKDCELVIYDTPGLQEGTKALNQAICRNAIQVLRNAKQGNELVAVVIDPVEIILSKKNKNLSQIERIPEIIRSNDVNIPMKLKIVPTIMKSDLIRNEKEKMITAAARFDRPEAAKIISQSIRDLAENHA